MLGGTRRHGTRNTKPASSISRTQIKVDKAGSNSINLDEAQTAPLPHCALGEFQSFFVEAAGVESSLGTGFRALTGSYGLLRVSATESQPGVRTGSGVVASFWQVLSRGLRLLSRVYRLS